jgi:predicted neutral ceramidase superfamily lipid hydrolase
MKLWKLILISVLAAFIFYGAMAYLFIKVANEIDSNGGLKAVVERIWEGNKQ